VTIGHIEATAGQGKAANQDDWRKQRRRLV
jgi:hypothetical protein